MKLSEDAVSFIHSYAKDIKEYLIDTDEYIDHEYTQMTVEGMSWEAGFRLEDEEVEILAHIVMGLMF